MKPALLVEQMKTTIRMLIPLFLLYCIALPPLAAQEAPFALPERRELLKIRSAVLETNKGTVFLELFPEDAPWHVANFKFLADKGFYKGLKFHRYEVGYFIQGGDPRGNGYGGPGYTLPPEFSPRRHKLGTLGMARKPDSYDKKGNQVNPERRSSGSSFTLFLGDAPQLDGQFTIFGKVASGFDVLSELRAGDTIENVTVYVRESGGR